MKSAEIVKVRAKDLTSSDRSVSNLCKEIKKKDLRIYELTMKNRLLRRKLLALKSMVGCLECKNKKVRTAGQTNAGK